MTKYIAALERLNVIRQFTESKCFYFNFTTFCVLVFPIFLQFITFRIGFQFNDHSRLFDKRCKLLNLSVICCVCILVVSESICASSHQDAKAKKYLCLKRLRLDVASVYGKLRNRRYQKHWVTQNSINCRYYC